MHVETDRREVTIDGRHLALETFIDVVRRNAVVRIDAEAVARMRESQRLVEKKLRENAPSYGINTGFGDFSKIAISVENANQLQNNLILSHCVATGDPYPEEVVRGILLLRANALCEGLSGIRPELVQTMVDMLNRGVHPVIPEKGSLGASGDLAPLAHMALVIIGRGEAVYGGRRMPGAEAMALAGIPTHSLRAKEGLALINGTQAMTSVGALAFYDTLRAAQLADVIGSTSMEALCGIMSAFDARVQDARPHAGQQLVARNFRRLNAGSEILRAAQGARVQDAYALRCIPQVHGAIRGALAHIREVLETEMNAVTDNPLIFAEDGQVISGGNFHGEPLALAFDYLGIACSELANISERRLERMVNAQLSNGLPPFLVRDGGINSGFMIVQYAAASMVSENKVLAHPASVDSIPSSANQEDHVSMGTTAARKSRLIVENTLSVLAMELMAAVQGIELRGGKPSPVHRRIVEIVRREVAFWDKDREFREDVARMNRLVRSDALLDCVREEIPDFE